MDILLTHSALKKFLSTQADPKTIAEKVSLCGPTFDRLHSTANSDTVYEIEAITNRVDTACALGIARESAIILNQFGLKAKLQSIPTPVDTATYRHLSKKFHFEIDPGLTLRFTAVAIEKIKIKPSSSETQDLLTNCGQRPINNLIDITNELTLLYGIPSHVFDLDKLASQKLHLRLAQTGETVTCLDSSVNELKDGDIVIEDGSGRLVDLCGIMGGSVAEVDEHTTSALLIIPIYQPKNIRKTSLRLQKRTLAAQIYEKNPDTGFTLSVLNVAIKLISERTGGKVSSPVFDSQEKPLLKNKISFQTEWLNRFVGIDIPQDNIKSILEGLGFTVEIDRHQFHCTVPSWRQHDLSIPEDLAEEIARVYGYFRIPPVMPNINLLPEAPGRLLKTEKEIKNLLSGRGFTEIFNSSLIPEKLITDTGLDSGTHLKLQNALSSDFEYLRVSLLPSLLSNLKNNQGKDFTEINLFEVSNIYLQDGHDLPQENSEVAILSTKPYLDLKGELELLFSKLNTYDISFSVLKDQTPIFDQLNTAVITSRNKPLGFIGKIKPSILHKMSLKSDPTAVIIDTQPLLDAINPQTVYIPLSDFPSLNEDITLNSKLPVGDIITIIRNQSDLIKQVKYLGSYKTKHSFNLRFESLKKNLEQSDIDPIKDKLFQQFS